MAPSATVLASSKLDAVGDRRHEVLGNADDLCMVRALRARTGDPVAGSDAFEPGADLDDDSGGGVARRRPRGELSLDDVPCPADAHRRYGLNHLLCMLGILCGQLPHGEAASLQSAELRSDGNAGPLNGHECGACFKRRRWDIIGDSLAPANKNLFHGILDVVYLKGRSSSPRLGQAALTRLRSSCGGPPQP